MPEELKELLDRADSKTLRQVWLMVRHLAGGEPLNADELDELRECCVSHNFDLKRCRLA